MRAKSVPPCDEKITQAKLLYDSGVTPIGEILELLGLSVGQFRRFREHHGWPLRASACAPKKPQEAALAVKRPRDAGRLIARLEDAVEQEFARAEAALAKHAPKTIEASARTLASLVKTLAELKRMRRESEDKKNDADDDSDQSVGDASEGGGDAPPRELAELRAELARRLERLRGAGPTE
ncbi:hypothetical protein F7D13_05610 [Methylocystis rosea]|uniref:Helix-turn-helix domain-containing protein n=1 Tax=Methylocystis rosea TaxID=173366 RepID=A0ABX6EHW2_9HYPH|nr:hypothetical protein [Methylocystis rosea]QGM93543.1 hypothetical protein F7D13_05610 [Methylocystis rosea]